MCYEGAVKRCRRHDWLWCKTSWKPRDHVTERQSGRVSLDTTLAEDSANFEVVKGGGKNDHWVIRRWDLFESDNQMTMLTDWDTPTAETGCVWNAMTSSGSASTSSRDRTWTLGHHLNSSFALPCA